MRMFTTILLIAFSWQATATDQCKEAKALAWAFYDDARNSVLKHNTMPVRDFDGNARDPLNLEEIDGVFKTVFSYSRQRHFAFMGSGRAALLNLSRELYFKNKSYRERAAREFNSAILDLGAYGNHRYVDAVVTSQALEDKIWICITGKQKFSAALCYGIKYVDFLKNPHDLEPIPYVRKDVDGKVAYTAIHNGIDFEKYPTLESYVKHESDAFCQQKVVTTSRDANESKQAQESSVEIKEESVTK